MGRLGYQSEAQATLAVSYNSLDSYAGSLHDALTRPYPPYEKIGIRNLGGDYNQLATTLLQIENEFYGTIRPKRVIRPGERPLHALRERGVEYIEVRCMDLDPFVPVGIAAATMRFLDIFLLHCLLADSPPDTPEEIAALGRNQHHTATHGREPGLRLERGGRVGAADRLGGRTAAAVRADRRRAGRRARRQRLRRRRGRRARPAWPSPRRCRRRACWRRCSATSAAATPPSSAPRPSRRATTCWRCPGAPRTRRPSRRWRAVSVEKRLAIEAADTVDFETFRQAYLSEQTLEPQR